MPNGVVGPYLNVKELLVARHPDTSTAPRYKPDTPLSCRLEYFNQFLLNLVSFARSAFPC